MQQQFPVLYVVDDDPTIRLTIQALLEIENYQLVFFENGASFLEQIRHQIPDLVLLDAMMPGMDGFEVCRVLRSDHRLDIIPIIMVTALDDQSSLLKGFEAGVDHFVSKPFNRQELRARIRASLRPKISQLVGPDPETSTG